MNAAVPELQCSGTVHSHLHSYLRGVVGHPEVNDDSIRTTHYHSICPLALLLNPFSWKLRVLGDVGTLGPAGAAALLHGGEEEANCGGEQCVHGLIQQLGREDAPDEEVVAQSRDQYHVGCRRHGAQQGQAVAAMADRH